MTALIHGSATAIHPLPATLLARGFRLLMLRQFQGEAAPPSFARIAQEIFRDPERPSRHGLAFGCAFRPEIVAWLTDRLGRPSCHDDSGRARRNPRWPSVCWRSENDRCWPDGTRTIEWSVEVIFDDEQSWRDFRECWQHRLTRTDERGPAWSGQRAANLGAIPSTSI
jgi:hypothetical protein